MSARGDAAILRAQERLRVAAELARKSYGQVRAAKRELRWIRDPLAAWIIEGLHSTVYDCGLADAPRLLLEDVAPLPEARAYMRRLQAEGERVPTPAEVRAARKRAVA